MWPRWTETNVTRIEVVLCRSHHTKIGKHTKVVTVADGFPQKTEFLTWQWSFQKKKIHQRKSLCSVPSTVSRIIGYARVFFPCFSYPSHPPALPVSLSAPWCLLVQHLFVKTDDFCVCKLTRLQKAKPIKCLWFFAVVVLGVGFTCMCVCVCLCGYHRLYAMSLIRHRRRIFTYARRLKCQSGQGCLWKLRRHLRTLLRWRNKWERTQTTWSVPPLAILFGEQFWSSQSNQKMDLA